MVYSRFPRFRTLIGIVQKLFISMFVVCSFIVYAVHERLTNPDIAAISAEPTESSATNGQFLSSEPAPTLPSIGLAAAPTEPQHPANQKPTQTLASRPTPTIPPTPPSAKSNGLYRDGSFTGGSVNAYWGLVQVKATVQNGKITDVQFVQYPRDRRTSQFINNAAMPYLKTEAIQAQNANVDLISGATLTSQAFIRSLQSALSSAKN